MRSASPASLRAGVRALLAEQASRPSDEKTHGAGLLLAESILGVSHGLHSRAPAVLQLALQEDLLQPEDLTQGSRKSAAAAAAVAAAAAPAVLEGEQAEEVTEVVQRKGEGRGLCF